MPSTDPTRSCQAHLDIRPPRRCYYADQPGKRPHCTLAASVRYGAVPLCPSCAQQRSTLGKGIAPAQLAISRPVDVLAWIVEAQAATAQADRHLAAAVVRARSSGHTWTEIADRLGVTRQAAQQRFRHDLLDGV